MKKISTKKVYRKPTIGKTTKGRVCGSSCGRHWGCGELVRRT